MISWHEICLLGMVFEKADMNTALLQSQSGTENKREGNASVGSENPSDYELVERFLPLVHKIVGKLCKRLPTHVEYDDLHSIGTVGLIHAVRKYSCRDDKTFEAYASMRIRGSIIDELRKMDTLPRSARAKAREVETVVAKLELELGRVPNDSELQRSLGLSGTEFRRLMNRVRPTYFVSLDGPQVEIAADGVADLHEIIADESQQPTSEKLQNAELVGILSDRISGLPDRQKKVLAMYYYEEMRLAQIADVFGVTEARICQIHGQAIRTLREQVTLAMDR